MLLNESQSSTSPSRNSSPDVVVLALANPDTGRPGDRSHPPSPPGVPLLLPAVVTVHGSDSDPSDEPLEREGARTTTAEQQGQNPGNTLRDEGTNDRNISNPIAIAARVPSNDGATATAGSPNRLGLVIRGGLSNMGHGLPIPIPIPPSTPLHPVPVSGATTTTMGRPPSSANPHTRELERYADALLQRNTISAVIQMATALALQ